MTHPTRGTVRVLGHRLGRVDIRDLRRSIGHVNPHHPLRTALSVHEVVLTGATGSPLLLLDEPSIGLDVAAREQLLQTIDEVLTTELVSQCFSFPTQIERHNGRWLARAGHARRA